MINYNVFAEEQKYADCAKDIADAIVNAVESALNSCCDSDPNARAAIEYLYNYGYKELGEKKVEMGLAQLTIAAVESVLEETKATLAEATKAPAAITFGEMYKFIQVAPTDEVGHVINPNIPGIRLHVYSNKRQCNIEEYERASVTNPGDLIPKYALIFDPDEKHVKVFKVNNGVTDYNQPCAIKAFGDDTGKFLIGLDNFIASARK